MDPFASVLAEPGSIAARKTLAAAWHASGDPRAELIEKQLALRELERANQRGSEPARVLRAWIEEALARNGDAWAGKLANLVRGYRFHGGLIAEIWATPRELLQNGPVLFKLAPIQHLNLKLPLTGFAELVAAQDFARIVTLDAGNFDSDFTDALAIELARGKSAVGLRWINLLGNRIGPPGVEAMAASPYLANAQYIQLHDNPADPTPYVQEHEDGRATGRPPLAAELERAFGARPWLATPPTDAAWPPDRYDLAITA